MLRSLLNVLNLFKSIGFVLILAILEMLQTVLVVVDQD